MEIDDALWPPIAAASVTAVLVSVRIAVALRRRSLPREPRTEVELPL